MTKREKIITLTEVVLIAILLVVVLTACNSPETKYIGTRGKMVIDDHGCVFHLQDSGHMGTVTIQLQEGYSSKDCPLP